MVEPRVQNFGNHAQFTPAYHFFTAPLGVVYFVWAVWRLVAAPGADTAFALVGAVALLGAIGVSRTQALKVQDRVIRLEERLRLARVLPVDLHHHIGALTPSQLVALRFASDEEAPLLVREITANPSIRAKEIKQRVKNWQADWFRA